MTNLNSLSYADTSSKVTAKHIWSWHTVVGQSHHISSSGTQGTTPISACSHCRHLGPKRAPTAGCPCLARGISKNQQVSETTCKGIKARFRIHFEGITLRKHHRFDKPGGGGNEYCNALTRYAHLCASCLTKVQNHFVFVLACRFIMFDLLGARLDIRSLSLFCGSYDYNCMCHSNNAPIVMISTGATVTVIPLDMYCQSIFSYVRNQRTLLFIYRLQSSNPNNPASSNCTGPFPFH